jgi:hypothetical protein
VTPGEWLRLTSRLDAIEGRLSRIEGAINLGRYLGIVGAGIGGAVLGALITKGTI